MKNEIREIFKKNPQIAKHIIKISENDKNFSIEGAKALANKLTQYKHVFKNNQFDITKYQTLESATDKVDNIILEQKATAFLKQNTSSKYRKLITKTTHNHIKDAINMGVDLNEINENIIIKIASFKTSQAFNRAILKYIESKTETSIDVLWKKIKKQHLI